MTLGAEGQHGDVREAGGPAAQSSTSGVMAGRTGLRWRVVVLVVIQVAIPSALLAARWADPTIGQQRGGWQMHTACWGRAEPCR